jgi:hypothetical protein
MRRLVWSHAGRKRIMLVLSWRGSIMYRLIFSYSHEILLGKILRDLE